MHLFEEKSPLLRVLVWSLLIPVVLMLLPMLYNRQDLVVGGFPLFYWFQMLMLLVTSLLIGWIYWLRTPKESRLKVQPGELWHWGQQHLTPQHLMATVSKASTTILGNFRQSLKAKTTAEHQEVTLREWGLTQEGFGPVMHWFVAGAMRYTAFTYIAAPALLFGTGAGGYYVIVYTILANIIMFVVLPDFWEVCKQHGALTIADLVYMRFQSHFLEMAIALTGILGTLSYLALQMYAVDLILNKAGLQPEVPLVVLYLVISIITYFRGIRAIAASAVVKDVVTVIFTLAAFFIIPYLLGGWGHIFHNAGQQLALIQAKFPQSGTQLVLTRAQITGFMTLSSGTALALFLYPHNQLSILSARTKEVVVSSAVWIPLFTLIILMLTLLGYAAWSARVPYTHTPTIANPFGNNIAIPALFINELVPWLVAFTFVSIIIGALVASIGMSIASACHFARNLYTVVKTYYAGKVTEEEEATAAQIASIMFKVGALAIVIVVLEGDKFEYVANFQQLGGVWVLQTLPAAFLSLYFAKPWLTKRSLLFGWAVGMIYVSWYVIAAQLKTATLHTFLGLDLYVGMIGLVLNIAAAAIWTGTTKFPDLLARLATMKSKAALPARVATPTIRSESES